MLSIFPFHTKRHFPRHCCIYKGNLLNLLSKIGQKFHITFFVEMAYNNVLLGIENVNSGASPPLSATCIFAVLRYCKCDLYILGASPPQVRLVIPRGGENRPSLYEQERFHGQAA